MLYLSQFARRLLIACCFCSGLTLSVRGVTIDPGCAAWDPKINEALNEAVSIANYGTTRWQGRPLPRPGTLLQDMLGAPNEDDETTLNFASAWFGRAASAVNSNLKIYCGDSHLNFLAAGKFRDPQNGNAQVSVGSSNTACGGTLRAFAYSATPSNVIVLCSDSDNGALRPSTRVTINTWNIGGDFRLNTRGIDTFGNYLSYKILHELFHCASFQQFPALLPSGISERYEFAQITTGVSADDRQHNADSMALLGCAWYLAPYFFENGQAKLAPKAARPNPPA